MKETFKENPQDQQDNKFAVTVRDFLAASSEPEDLSIYFKNKEFIFEFPALAVYLIGSKGRAEFSEDQRAGLFSLSLQTFLSNNNRALTGYSFTKDGKFVGGHHQGEDSAAKALTASILLIGMSLPDKKGQRSLLIDSYQNMDQNRKSNLLTTLGRLLAKNNITRTWIKENKIDADNGFDWDRELSQLLFFGIYASGVEHFYIPKDMQQDVIKDFSLEARRVILNFALEYADKLKKSRFSAKLWDFRMQMKAMEMTDDMRKQLSLFEQKVGLK